VVGEGQYLLKHKPGMYRFTLFILSYSRPDLWRLRWSGRGSTSSNTNQECTVLLRTILFCTVLF